MGYSRWCCKKLDYDLVCTHMHRRLKIQKEEEIVDIVRVSQVAPVVKNLPATAGDIKDG